MSGKYLHGLIIDSDLVDVRDNIFSHSELREKWTGKEGKNKLIQEWSWDYVTREFIETPSQLIPTVAKWIKKNLSTHEQLTSWVNRNWEGLVNGDEREREFYVWRLISHKAKYKNKLVDKFLKAGADWHKAYADWHKAGADRDKAGADQKKAYADWHKADADWHKAGADRHKAGADWQKADADRDKAEKTWKTKIMKPVFMELLKKYPNTFWEVK